MSLFSRNKEAKVQGLVLKVVNTHCPRLAPLIEDARADNRVNLSIVVVVVPLKDGRIQLDDAFAAVTKDVSNTGMAIVVPEPTALDRVIVGLRMEEEMFYVRAEAKHLNPMGSGFFSLGLRLLEVVAAGDYPGLESLRV